ncbi:MAG: hypothetical protein AB9844_00210 [Clostridiaceae bacterium]
MNIYSWGSSAITIISVLLGGCVTYFVQSTFAKKESLRIKKQDIYLEFLQRATSIHTLKNMNEYWDTIRKLYLIADISVMETIVSVNYIPEKGEEFVRPKAENEPLKRIILAMRKDLGYKTDDKQYEKFQFVHWYSAD